MNAQQLKQAFLWLYGEARQEARRQWRPDHFRLRTIQILAVIPVMALPKRYRQGMLEFNDQEIARAGAVSGMFQFAFFGLLYAAIYFSFRSTFYEVVGKEKADPPRPNVYLLKRPPSWKLVVRPETYNPFEAQKP